MLRRVAITLATVAAAGLMAATPAVADGWEGGKSGAGYQGFELERGSAEYTNLGGPYGITYAKERKFELEAERGYLYSQYLQGR